jgi:exoribonuclease R
MKETIIWKFQAWEHFGFLIPKNRDFYGGDFYVRKKNFWEAKDGDKVEWVEIKSSWKKPEVRVIKVISSSSTSSSAVRENGKNTNQEFIEWIYSAWDGNFGFIDVEWQEKWYFVYWDKKWKAKDWDKVKAQIVEFKGKKEAIIVKVFKNEFETTTWIFKDNGGFGFVITEKQGDIFIPWMKKNGANDWDKVEVKITKMWKKNKEGIVIMING